jgi:hypothetical protein
MHTGACHFGRDSSFILDRFIEPCQVWRLRRIGDVVSGFGKKYQIKSNSETSKDLQSDRDASMPVCRV